MAVSRTLPLICVSLLVAGCGGGQAAPPDTTQGPDAGRSANARDAQPANGVTHPPQRLRLIRVGTFEQPLYVTHAPGRSGIVVLEKTGRALLVDGDERTTLVDLRGDVSTGSEQGLLGIAFHPRFAGNGRLFVNYTDPSGTTRIVEYRLRGQAAAERHRELLRIEQPYPNHNGGQLAFGPDGKLWIGVGDGGAAGDPQQRAQDPGDLLGSILRLDVDAGDRAYGVPESNPFADDSPVSGAPEIWAVGLRNPWRFSFDRASGALLIADVGQNQWEEINAVDWRSPPRGGYNFGWDRFEGRTRFEDTQLVVGTEHTEPVHVYSHEDGCSVTGGYVYRGSAVPALRGWYVFADYCSSWIRTFAIDADAVGSKVPAGKVREYPGTAGISSFGEDAAGELYVTALDGGVFRIAAGR